MRSPLPILLAAAVFIVAGCDSRTEAPSRGGASSDTCASTNDCAEGLLCLFGACIADAYPIDAEPGVCAATPECSADADCPAYTGERCISARCAFFCASHADCLLAEDFHATSCDGSTGACVEGCAADEDCDGLRSLCDTARSACVDCVTDDDCSGPDRCEAGTCVEGCDSDSDCAGFHACVSRSCEPAGCSSDEQCVFWTSRPEAGCDVESGECRIPCDTDGECNLDGFDFQVCEEGHCLFVGCASDAECRALRGAGWDCVEG